MERRDRKSLSRNKPEPSSIQEALEATRLRKMQEAEAAASLGEYYKSSDHDQSLGSFVPNVAEYPTPHNEQKRYKVERVEVNIKSLEQLTRDLESFLSQARNMLAQSPSERDGSREETVMEYFQNLSHLVEILDRDIIFGPPDTKDSDTLAKDEIASDLRESLQRSCATIMEQLEMTQTDDVWQEKEAGNVYSFATYMRDIMKKVKELQEYLDH